MRKSGLGCERERERGREEEKEAIRRTVTLSHLIALSFFHNKKKGKENCEL